MTWQDLIGNFSYVLLTFSYLVTNMIGLRVLAIAALSFEGLYMYVGAETPLWVGICWAVVFVLINCAQVGRLLRERMRASLDEQQRALRRWICPQLDDVAFQKLFGISLPVRFAKGEVMCRQGEAVQTLFVILDGEAAVSMHGKCIRRLGAGSLVGEVSFFGDDIASASVTVEHELAARAFPKAALRELFARHQTIQNALTESIGRSLASKLADRDPLAASTLAG